MYENNEIIKNECCDIGINFSDTYFLFLHKNIFLYACRFYYLQYITESLCKFGNIHTIYMYIFNCVHLYLFMPVKNSVLKINKM